MTPASTARTWLVGLLSELGGTASAADLRQRWDDELSRTVDAMLTTDELTEADGRWSLPSNQPAGRPGRWSEAGIAIAVQAYLEMLRAEHDGQPVHRREATAAVVAQSGQPVATVEAMFANISAVVQELGFEYLGAYPPKSNVPAGVRPAVSAAINA